MAEPTFSKVAETPPFDDDLPRTLRREHANQARRAESTATAKDRQARPALTSDQPPERAASIAPKERWPTGGYGTDDSRATVTRLEIPFLHLMVFFLKAVIAAILALILLLVLLWLAGESLTATFPDLVKMQVLIRMPN